MFSRTKNPSVLVCPFLTAKFFLVVGRYFQFLPCVVHIGEKKGKILPTCIFVSTYIDFIYLCLNGVTVLTSYKYSIDNINHIFHGKFQLKKDTISDTFFISYFSSPTNEIISFVLIVRLLINDYRWYADWSISICGPKFKIDFVPFLT